jgi:hypothetical protein
MRDLAIASTDNCVQTAQKANFVCNNADPKTTYHRRRVCSDSFSQSFPGDGERA